MHLLGPKKELLTGIFGCFPNGKAPITTKFLPLKTLQNSKMIIPSSLAGSANNNVTSFFWYEGQILEILVIALILVWLSPLLFFLFLFLYILNSIKKRIQIVYH